MKKVSLFILVSVLICLSTGTALAVELNPTADMTTTPTSATTTTAFVEICFRPAHQHPDTRGSILFDLEPYMGWNVDSAILNINVFYMSSCGLPTTFHTYAATENWDESWSGNHLTHGTTDWGIFTIDELQWYQLDVTDLVHGWLSSSIDNHGLVFESVNDNQAEHRFYSNNASVPSVRPYLTLSFPQALEGSTWAGIKNSF